jgi:PAS domain S-box-containing protein
LPDEGSQETTTASSENNYQALFEATEEALLVVGRDGRYLDANSAMCELTEYTRTELRTMQVGDLAGLPPQRRRDVLKRMSGGERWRLDLEIPRKNGGHVPVEVVGEPVNLPAGSAYRFAAREISERRAREQLQRDLLAMVSHELRNPLAGLLEWARMIESGRTDPGKAIPIIARQAAELERLIGELVDTVRISSDHVHLDRSWFDLRDLVQESVQDYEMLAPEQVELESPATPVRGHWDRVRLGQESLIECDQVFAPGRQGTSQSESQ